MLGDQFIPHGVVAFNITNFADALAVGRIVAPPEIERVDVEIVAIDVHAELGDALREQIGQPSPRGRVAKVIEPAFFAAQHEFGMLAGDLRVLGHAFRFEPHNVLHAQLMTNVANRLQTAGKFLGLAEPVADAVREVADKPTGIEPEMVGAVLRRQLGSGDLTGLGGPARSAVVAVKALRGERKLQRPHACRTRRVAEHQQPTESLVGCQAVALPRHQQDAWASDFFTGMKHQMRFLHAGAQTSRAFRCAIKLGGPLARPTDGRDDALSGKFEIEEWKRGGVRGPTSAGRHRDALTRRQRRFGRQERLFVASVAVEAV